MKSIAIKLTLVLTTIFFTACSNMQVGFEEDSPFYTPPSEKTVEEKVTPVVTKTKEQPSVAQEQPKAQEASVKTESKVEEVAQVKAPQSVKEQATPTKKEVPVVDEEAETTFSYSREDGE